MPLDFFLTGTISTYIAYKVTLNDVHASTVERRTSKLLLFDTVMFIDYEYIDITTFPYLFAHLMAVRTFNVK